MVAPRRFANRVGWATTHLYQSGLIERPDGPCTASRRVVRKILAEHPEWGGSAGVLSQFEEFHEFRGRSPVTDTAPITGVEFEPGGSDEAEDTPEEEIDSAYRLLRTALAAVACSTG